MKYNQNRVNLIGFIVRFIKFCLYFVFLSTIHSIEESAVAGPKKKSQKSQQHKKLKQPQQQDAIVTDFVPTEEDEKKWKECTAQYLQDTNKEIYTKVFVRNNILTRTTFNEWIQYKKSVEEEISELDEAINQIKINYIKKQGMPKHKELALKYKIEVFDLCKDSFFSVFGAFDSVQQGISLISDDQVKEFVMNVETKYRLGLSYEFICRATDLFYRLCDEGFSPFAGRTLSEGYLLLSLGKKMPVMIQCLGIMLETLPNVVKNKQELNEFVSFFRYFLRRMFYTVKDHFFSDVQEKFDKDTKEKQKKGEVGVIGGQEEHEKVSGEDESCKNESCEDELTNEHLLDSKKNKNEEVKVEIMKQTSLFRGFFEKKTFDDFCFVCFLLGVQTDLIGAQTVVEEMFRKKIAEEKRKQKEENKKIYSEENNEDIEEFKQKEGEVIGGLKKLTLLEPDVEQTNNALGIMPDLEVISKLGYGFKSNKKVPSSIKQIQPTQNIEKLYKDFYDQKKYLWSYKDIKTEEKLLRSMILQRVLSGGDYSRADPNFIDFLHDQREKKNISELFMAKMFGLSHVVQSNVMLAQFKSWTKLIQLVVDAREEISNSKFKQRQKTIYTKLKGNHGGKIYKIKDTNVFVEFSPLDNTNNHFYYTSSWNGEVSNQNYKKMIDNIEESLRGRFGNNYSLFGKKPKGELRYVMHVMLEEKELERDAFQPQAGTAFRLYCNEKKQVVMFGHIPTDDDLQFQQGFQKGNALWFDEQRPAFPNGNIFFRP